MSPSLARGQTSKAAKERLYPFAVDITIPPDGFGGRFMRLIDGAMLNCRRPVERWTYREVTEGGGVRWISRIGLGDASEADWVAAVLKELSPRRVR